MLCALKLGDRASFAKDHALGVYRIDLARLRSSKTEGSSVLRLPASDTPLFDRWLSTYRPALLREHGGQDCGFLFLTRDGKPRREVSYAIQKLIAQYTAMKATPHSFRHMQVRWSMVLAQCHLLSSAVLRRVRASARAFLRSNIAPCVAPDSTASRLVADSTSAMISNGTKLESSEDARCYTLCICPETRKLPWIISLSCATFARNYASICLARRLQLALMSSRAPMNPRNLRNLRQRVCLPKLRCHLQL